MKTLFIGNRGGVLAEMLKQTDVVAIGAMSGTYLERDAILDGREYESISTYADVIDFFDRYEADMIVSNGLPFILKASDIGERPIVNIHPSFLPDLKGIDPVLGSILFERNAGATCHQIDAGIDTGPIISRVLIPYSEDLNASLLYQLSFRAEAQAFTLALARNFEPEFEQEDSPGLIYFSRRPESRILPFSEGIPACLRVLRAFDNRNQGARFFTSGIEYQAHSGCASENSFLRQEFSDARNLEIVMVFEDTVVVKVGSDFLLLSEVPDADSSLVGMRVEGR